MSPILPMVSHIQKTGRRYVCQRESFICDYVIDQGHVSSNAVTKGHYCVLMLMMILMSSVLI